MRLSRIDLVNFRCFREGSVDLSGDIVAIYGRNGTGKTTLFDAIEIALLGSLGRFEGWALTNAHLRRVGAKEPFCVSVECDDSTSVRVSGKSDHGLSLLLETSTGQRTHRDFLYDVLLDPNYLPPKRETTAVAELFRASLLLSQDSIRHFIDATPEERARVLACLSGSGYLQKCLDKARDVLKEVERQARDCSVVMEQQDVETANLDRELADRDARISELNRSLGSTVVDREAVVQLMHNVGLSVKPESFAVDGDSGAFVAAGRAACEERIAAHSARAKLLAQLEVVAERQVLNTKRRQELSAEIERYEAEVETLTAREQQIAKRLVEIDAELAAAGAAASAALRELAHLEHILLIWTEYSDLRRELEDASRCFRQAEEELRASREHARKQEEASEAAARSLDQERQSASVLETRLAGLRALGRALPSYSEILSRVEKYDAECRAFVLRRDELTRQLAELRSAEHEAQAKAVDLESSVERLRATLGAQAELASRLLAYVRGSDCPLCGHAHPSEADLRAAIGARSQEVPQELTATSEQLRDVSDRLTSIQGSIRAGEAELEWTRSTLRTYEEQQALLLSSARETERMATALAVSTTIEAADSALGEVTAQLRERQLRFQVAQQKAQEAEQEILRKKERVEILDRTSSNLSERRRDLTERLSVVEMKLVEAGEGIDSGRRGDEVSVQISASRKRLVELTESHQAVEGRRRSCLADLQANRGTREANEAALRDRQAVLFDMAAQMEDFERHARSADLPPNCTPSQIREVRTELSSTIAPLSSVLQRLEQYECSQRIASLESELRQLHDRLKASKAARVESHGRHSALLGVKNDADAWIESLSEAVDKIVGSRICQHQREIVRYFKAMLPCPYLFDSIIMAAGSTGIELGLQFRGQSRPSGEPQFFLSNAQANVLALAVFLSFARQQKWSRLRTLLLDDPVQHLDDLDAVAFLDNLRALALGYSGDTAQVILSTCDLDLYLLMIRKFGTLNQEGIRFRGLSLIDSGPAGPRVHYDVDSAIDEPRYERAG